MEYITWGQFYMRSIQYVGIILLHSPPLWLSFCGFPAVVVPFEMQMLVCTTFPCEWVKSGTFSFHAVTMLCVSHPDLRCETVQNTRCVHLHHHLADWSHVVISGLTPCVGHKRAWPVRICPFFLLFSFLYEKPYCLLCEDWRWLAPLKAKLTIKTRICCFSGWFKGKLRESM